MAVKLTNSLDETRICCTTATAAESKPHVGIARRAKRLIVINGWGNRFASKVWEQEAIPYEYETVIAEEGVKKMPTLDFDMVDVGSIATKIAKEAMAFKLGSGPWVPGLGVVDAASHPILSNSGRGCGVRASGRPRRWHRRVRNGALLGQSGRVWAGDERRSPKSECDKGGVRDYHHA